MIFFFQNSFDPVRFTLTGRWQPDSVEDLSVLNLRNNTPYKTVQFLPVAMFLAAL